MLHKIYSEHIISPELKVNLTSMSPAILPPDGNGEMDTLLSSLPSKGVDALWLCMDKMVPPHPNPQAQPALWKYKEIRPALLEAGRLIGAKEAERRVLMLVNPALGKRLHSKHPRHDIDVL